MKDLSRRHLEWHVLGRNTYRIVRFSAFRFCLIRPGVSGVNFLFQMEPESGEKAVSFCLLGDSVIVALSRADNGKLTAMETADFSSKIDRAKLQEAADSA
jgi:hypothetical protein